MCEILCVLNAYQINSNTVHHPIYELCLFMLLNVFVFYISVTMDDFSPSLVTQVMPNPTPAEILIVTVGKRNGIFQVSLGNGEGTHKIWRKTSWPFKSCYTEQFNNHNKVLLLVSQYGPL